MSLCTSIELIRKTNSYDLLKVTIDNITEAYWFHDYTDALKFLNKEVIVEFRKDVLDGQLQQVICTFVEPVKVNVLDKKDNFKLYLDQEDNNANISFNEIAIGETRPSCIVYCIKSSFESSSKAVWQELLIRDKSMRVTTLRVFHYENMEADFTGQYILTELTRNSFGFKSDLITRANGECPPNPEIDIAKQYITNYFSNDVIASSYITQTNLIGFLEEHLDFEPGYGLVRLAMELAMVDAMDNITKDVDLQAIGQALLVSRGHLVRNSVLSDSFNNIALAMQSKWPNKALVLQLIDEALIEKPKEYTVFKSVQDAVATLLNVRKGIDM